jgi:hypothetical protein
LGVSRSFEKALQYFRNAAAYGHVEASFYLAKMNHFGIGIGENCVVSAELYKRVVFKGSWMKDHMRAFEAFEMENYDLALLLYEKIAMRGSFVAQLNAAWMHDNHMASEEYYKFTSQFDYASRFYRYAADQGSPEANLRLGDFYYFGIGVDVDYSKAASFYRPLGQNSQALFNLGYMHHFGEGLPKDLHLAKRFYDTSLLVNPDGYLAVYPLLFYLGFEYSLQMIQTNQFGVLFDEFCEYIVPSVFRTFSDTFKFSDLLPISQATTEGSSTTPEAGNTSASFWSFLDNEGLFGYNWDSVLIFLFCFALSIGFLIKFGILQIQIQRVNHM